MDRTHLNFIIPFFNSYESTVRCFSSIINNVPNQDFRIIMIDDFSDNPDFLKHLSYHNRKIIPVRMKERSGFVKSIEEGFEHSSSPHIIIMHNDVTIPNINTIINLQRGLIRLKPNGVKLVSAKMENTGSSCEIDPNILNSKNDVIVNSPLPLICCLMHRDLFKNIDGFLKSYKFAYFDEELFYRMKKYGYKQAIVGNSFVNHEGSTTMKELIKKDKRILKIIDEDREKCATDIKKLI